MSPRGRPVSRPPSLSASGPISVTPRSSHPTDSSRSARARSASGLIDVHARASPVRGACASSLRTVLDESVPTRAQRVDLWATPAHVRHGCHRRPVAAAHSPCLSRPPERMWMDGRGPWPPERRTRVHGPTRNDSANPPRRPPARRHRPRAHFGPQGPTLGDLIDAYLQDYLVRQFRSHSTAPRPDRPSHRVLRPRRAGHRPDHLPDSASINSPGVPPGRPPAPSTGRPRPSIAWARSPSTGAGSTPCPASPTGSARIRPARASSSTLSTSPSAPIYPPRGRTSSMWPTTPAGASRRSSASLGRKLTRRAASSGSRRRARRRWWDGFSRSRPPSPMR